MSCHPDDQERGDMNAYEEMKNQILLNLTDRTQLTTEEIRKVVREIDREARGR